VNWLVERGQSIYPDKWVDMIKVKLSCI